MLRFISRWVVAALILLAGADRAHAGVQVTLDRDALSKILSVVAPRDVTVGLGPAGNLTLEISELEVIGIEPASNGGLGRLHVRMRLRAAQVGLDARIEPKVSLEVRRQEGLAWCYVRFEKVEVPMPWGVLDAAPLLPAVPVRADHVFEVVSAGGSSSGLRSSLVDARMSETTLALTFDIVPAALPVEEPAAAAPAPPAAPPR